jgi:hypothetical protein
MQRRLGERCRELSLLKELLLALCASGGYAGMVVPQTVFMNVIDQENVVTTFTV